MKTILLASIITFFAITCANNNRNGIPAKYFPLLDNALARAGANRHALEQAIEQASAIEREGVAFLIAYMPESDLTSMSTTDLLINVQLAYTARDRFSWARSVPDSIFLNDILPYASLNERRENWRVDFYQRFAPLVEQCTTLREAILAINRNIRNELKVDYNIRRRKPDQSPSESIEQGMASCSGLSILLTDAFRSVGIPSRIAGTARWHDNRGNHTWCEVWLDGKWHFTEYYPDSLDRAWFLPDAGHATPGDCDRAIWASSFQPTGHFFPLVWNRSINHVPAVDVSQRYIDIYQQLLLRCATDGNHVTLRIRAFKNLASTGASDDRLQLNVDVFRGNDQVGGGSTAGPTRDMNDVLEFLVEKNAVYTLKYWLPDGSSGEKNVTITSTPIDVTL